MLQPQAHISAQECERGIRFLMIDAAAATAIGALNSGVVLLALALHIGASTIAIGYLAAIPLLTQVLQAPMVKLVERVRRRKLLSVSGVFIARLALPIYAAVPFIPSRRVATIVLLCAALLHYGVNAASACSWNSWIRDLVPADRLGHFSSRRGLYGTIVSAGATVTAAVALGWAQGSETIGDRIFSALYIAGFIFGLISAAALAQVPEPVMAAESVGAPLHRLLWEPLRHANFRKLLRYVASWQFAVNLATPFFTVYFVRALGFSMSFVLMLTVISQLANVAFVRQWGRLSDRFTNKSTLAVASPLYLLCVAAMAFASDVPGDTARATYLILLHIVMGASGAGVGLAAGNIVMKLSPSGAATSFMATNALVSALAAGSAPIVGGWAADFFARRRLELSLNWFSPSGVEQLLGITFSHWEFFFLLSALLGLYSLHRLSAIEEPGAVERREVVQHIFTSARRTLRNASSVAGLRLAVTFPGGELIKLRERAPLLLENLFEDEKRVAAAPPRSAALAKLLGSAFEQPANDADFEDLLKRLDHAA
ncbi:putative major facilitator superfamily transporter [Sphingomonas changbaiensis NBRC 104936]|uniref:Putative major facilitator superfamily transporter n=1 Tax=Sphingomonas changbaiensis NBRC 104936 TaxID=1219043 RepID=A0A0E9MN86_9SPHN|nr:MFS transporter [Sphingomonas changbaiensis]GAO38963.1 putative major facilitator superfamily transporter [Sphingomonas changbaiensis NBRC 104936]